MTVWVLGGPILPDPYCHVTVWVLGGPILSLSWITNSHNISGALLEDPYCRSCVLPMQPHIFVYRSRTHTVAGVDCQKSYIS